MWSAELNYHYGYKPWEMERLTPKEWRQLRQHHSELGEGEEIG